MTRFALLLSLLALVGCGDDGSPPRLDAGRLDAGGRDAGPRPDAARRDTGPTDCVENRSCSTGDPCEEGHERCGSGTRVCEATAPAAADTPCTGGVCDGMGACLTVEDGVLIASDAALFDAFGGAIDLDGDRAIIGMGSPVSGTYGDAAYVFERDTGGRWREVARPATGDPTAGQFGVAVAISGGRVVIGSPGASHAGGMNAGAVYVWERQSDGSWMETDRLVAGDAAAYQRFGRAVDLDGDRLIVGRYSNGEIPGDGGAAYGFEHGTGGWLEVSLLTPSEAAEGDRFGASVAIDGDAALVGAPDDDRPGLTDAGSVWLFGRQSDASWIEEGRLTASDAADGDAFGTHVGLSGVRVIVGAPRADLGTISDAGAAYVFELRSGSVAREGKLTASDAAVEDGFGAVAVSGDLALVGSPRNDRVGRRDTGAAYVYSRASDGTWSEARKIVAGMTETDDRFGSYVALDGARALVGAPGDDHGGDSDAGSVYFFDPVP